MKVKHRILSSIVALMVFCVPSLTYAAWWNPFTWKIFNRTPTEKVQETKQPSEIEKLRSEVEELKKKTATPAPSAAKPSVVVGDKSKATKKPVIPVSKPVVTATELKKQNPQEYKTLIDENKTKLLEASKLLSNKNIIARVKPSVVYIETVSGSGSGIIVSADGYVLTNAHVVSGANSATVKLADGGSYNASVAGRDENTDLALLKISASGLSAAFLGDSDLVEQGDSVFTFGYPLGIEGDVAFKDGTLSRRQKINGTTYLEISAQILPGNSGGPLVNQAGEVVGINTLAIGALKVSGVLIGETLKFALPINVAKGLIPDLKNGRNVVIPKTPVVTQEPTPTPQPYIPPPTPYQPQPAPAAPPTYIPPAPVYVPEPIAPPVIRKELKVKPDKTSVLATGGQDIYFLIEYTEYDLGKHTTIEVIAPDPSKNRIIDNYGCQSFSRCDVSYAYIIPAVPGTYTFIFKAGGLEKTINIEATPFVEVKPWVTITEVRTTYPKQYTGEDWLASFSFGGLDNEPINIDKIVYSGDIVVQPYGVPGSLIGARLSKESGNLRGSYGLKILENTEKVGTFPIVISSVSGTGVFSRKARELLESPVTLDVTIE